jgi:hypothetical protein
MDYASGAEGSQAGEEARGDPPPGPNVAHSEDINSLKDQIQETVAHIRLDTDFVPDVGIVLGSELGPLADEIEMVSGFPMPNCLTFPARLLPVTRAN